MFSVIALNPLLLTVIVLIMYLPLVCRWKLYYSWWPFTKRQWLHVIIYGRQFATFGGDKRQTGMLQVPILGSNNEVLNDNC